MASSSLLSLSLLVLVLLVSISPTYTRKRSLLNGFKRNPIRTIASTAGVSENLLNLNRMEGKNDQQSGKSQNIRVGPWGGQVSSSNSKTFDDGAYTGIREINLAYNKEAAIGGLQVTYDLNGSPFVAENHTRFLSEGFTSTKATWCFSLTDHQKQWVRLQILLPLLTIGPQLSWYDEPPAAIGYTELRQLLVSSQF